MKESDEPQVTGATEARTTSAARRGVAMMAATMLISLGALAAVSTTAEAKALPPGYAPNGCTLSPDFGFVPTYYWFKGACNRHDYCYDELWYGGGENGRKACDNNFLREMQGWCNAQYRSLWQTFMKNQCNGVALVYYTAVRNLGQSYFDNPYKN